LRIEFVILLRSLPSVKAVCDFFIYCVICRYLPPHFPQDKPVFKVVPPVSHPWVDDNMIVTGCYSLNTVSSIVFCHEFIEKNYF